MFGGANVENEKERVILCVDLKSFYASCECVARGLDPLKTKLAVVSRLDDPGSMVLAISPALKQIGAPSRCRAFELQGYEDVMKVPVRMEQYLQTSLDIVEVYLDIVSADDLHVYSIDEAFLDVTRYLTLYKCRGDELAKKIIQMIYKRTKIQACCGIGPNLLMAKLALDCEAKQTRAQLAWWRMEDLKTKLWPLPLTKMWGIGRGYEQKLHQIGVYTVGELAAMDPIFIKTRFGKVGMQLYEQSHGCDETRIQTLHVPPMKSLSQNQVLIRPYNKDEIKTILLEQLEELTFRLRIKQLVCQTVAVRFKLSDPSQKTILKQQTLDVQTNLTQVIYPVCLGLLELLEKGSLIRQVGVSLSHLNDEKAMQLSLFEDLSRQRKLCESLDELRLKYGKNQVFKAISLKDEATGIKRQNQLGGHHR